MIITLHSTIRNVSLRGSVRALNQGVLYFQNVIIFRSTRVNVVYLRPFRSMTFHDTDFHESHKCSTALYVHSLSYTEFHSSRKINAERKDRKLFTPEVKWAFD
jgi:hypothetical protein